MMIAIKHFGAGRRARHGALVRTALSRDGSFKVEDYRVKPDPTPGRDSRPEVIAESDDFQTSGFVKILQLTISNPPNDWLPTAYAKEELRFTIINPDRKMATLRFETKAASC
jgi:hypothetical protein